MNTLKTALLMTTAALAVGFPRAFDAKNGWKLDADGKLALDANGDPIYVNTAGQEQSVRGDTIANLNSEAKAHRTAKEAAEAALLPFKDIDPVVAKKAIDTVKNFDSKKLIDADAAGQELERVRTEIKAEYNAQLTEAQKAISDKDGLIASLQIDKVFDGSELVRNGLAVPGDMFRSTFAKNFKYEDGKTVAYGPDGNKLLSKKVQGQYADPEEALSLLVEMHPQKDAILKANTGGGSGNGGGGGARGGGRTIRRDDFEALPPHQAQEAALAMGKGELTVVD